MSHDERRPLLEVRDLYLNFHTFDGISRVLNGVNLTIYPGETLGLVGETGCGKTMTALAITRLVSIPPGEIAGGQILFEGEDILQMSEEEVRTLRGRRIAMVFQDPNTNLNPVFPIGEQMVDVILTVGQDTGGNSSLTRTTRERRRQAREQAIALLRRVGIPDPEMRINHYPHQFSGGMKQRVLIAMALSGNPGLLIADEPTTALDVSIQAQILRLINSLVTEMRLAVLLVSHNLGVIARVCRRVAVMYAGNVVEVGPVGELFRNPKHPYTVGLINSIPRRGMERGALRGIKGVLPNLISPPSGCRFHPRCPHAMVACAGEFPRSKRVRPDHEVACYLYLSEETRGEYGRSLVADHQP